MFFRSPSIQVIGRFIQQQDFKGVREGKVIHYFPSGKVYCNGSYFADDRSGIWEYFTEEGVSDTIINYNE